MKIEEALKYISPDNYQDWIKVGMALKHEGYPLSLWDQWSSGSSKYRPGECERKWRSFSDHSSMVTAGTIIRMAKENGYDPNGTLKWDDPICDPNCSSKPAGTPTAEAPSPAATQKHVIPHMAGNPLDHLKTFLTEMFKPDEYVGYCDKLTRDDNHWKPVYSIKRRTAGELLKALEMGFDAASILPESPGGALIRMNPLDGNGEADRNITDYRYCLVESDEDSLDKQYELLHKMNLPVKMLIHSGNKSLHAVVHVDAPTADIYRERVAFIYDFCEKNGFTPDRNDRNPSRYTRMPGIRRGDNYQYIIELNIGAKDYDDWMEWLAGQDDGLPCDVSLADALANLPPLKDELIEGLLRIGHKMLLSAPSKAGKTFLLMNLAVCFAEGLKWLGHQCRQGRVLYVNLELDDATCIHRFKDIYNRMGIEPSNAAKITIWNLRGRTMPMDRLTPVMINRYRDKGYIAVILDPIYKVITGDENNATEMGEFCAYFDRAAFEISAAMIYCHHHSKGAQNKYANAADRSSGSGVFSRDPDTIIDMVQLKTSGTESQYHEEVSDSAPVISAWEITSTVREFPPSPPMRIWFDYPLHRIDDTGLLADAKYSELGQRGIGRSQKTREGRIVQIDNLFEAEAFTETEAISADLICEKLGISKSHLKKFVTQKSCYESGTLPDGQQVVFIRNSPVITFNNTRYSRPTNKNQRWIEMDE